jgi:hypothetical protein
MLEPLRKVSEMALLVMLECASARWRKISPLYR